MKKVLVVIDMQHKFIETCNAERIIPAVTEKIRNRLSEGYDILLTYDVSGGEVAADIIRLCRNTKIYKKESYGCAELILDLYKEKPDKIEFAGICTDICVIANVLGTMAFLPYAEIAVDKNCCDSKPENHIAALQVMKSCHIKIL